MDEATLLHKITYLPEDMIFFGIKEFLPISTLKRVRKIHPSEFPEDYKKLLQDRDCCFYLYDNFKMLYDNDETSISFLENMIQRNRDIFKDNLTASWFDYLEEELNLNERISNVRASQTYNETYKDRCFDEFTKCSRLIKEYGIVSTE